MVWPMGNGSGERNGKKKKESDGWVPPVVVGIEGDIEYGWVRKNCV